MKRLSAAAIFLPTIVLAASAIAVPLDPPAVSVIGSDRTSITLDVTAGASGAPRGFTVEWMTLADFQSAGGWPADPTVAQGSDFTGVPTLNVTPGILSFRLDAGTCVRVLLGRLFDETGVTSADREELDEGTEYVIRAWASGGPGFEQSLSCPTTRGVTLTRGPNDCTVTLGFWKNHPENWSRVASLVLGDVTYSRFELLAIFDQSARGNGLISLAHQLISAKLNLLLGAQPPSLVMTAIGEADALIGSNVVPPCGCGYLSPGQTSSLTKLLTDFNGGTLGPGHCTDPSKVVGTEPETWGSLKQRYR